MSEALQQVHSVLRNQAFEELAENADMGASYFRSLGEAAYRGDGRTVRMHLSQLRLVVMAMIKTHNDYLLEGSDAAVGASQAPLANRADQRPGDGMA